MESVRIAVDFAWTLTVAFSIWVAHRRISNLEDRVK
jgi:hypothetical protein